MKKGYLLVCCVIMVLTFLYLPMTRMNNVGSDTFNLIRYIMNVHIYGGSKLGYMVSFFGYVLIFIAAMFRKGVLVVKCLSPTVLVTPIMVLMYIVSDSPYESYTGAWIYCLLSVVFFILCLTLRSSDREPK